jgi:hypothetical protein
MKHGAAYDHVAVAEQLVEQVDIEIAKPFAQRAAGQPPASWRSTL